MPINEVQIKEIEGYKKTNAELLQKLIRILYDRKTRKVNDSEIFGYHGASERSAKAMEEKGIQFIEQMRNGAGELGAGFYVGSRFSYANTYAETIYPTNPKVISVSLNKPLEEMEGIIVHSAYLEPEQKLYLEEKYHYIIPQGEAENYVQHKDCGIQICFTKKALDQKWVQFVQQEPAITIKNEVDKKRIEEMDIADFSDRSVSRFFDHNIPENYVLHYSDLKEVNKNNSKIAAVQDRIGDNFKVYKDDNGKMWFVKDYYAMNNRNPGDNDVSNYVKNEVLASRIYQLCGVRVPEHRFLARDGKLLIASEFIEKASHKGGSDLASVNEKQKEDIFNGIAIDWLLDSTDWIGPSNGNLCFVDDNVYRIDFGATMDYRATALAKKTGDFVFTNAPKSLEDFLKQYEENFLNKVSGYRSNEVKEAAYNFLKFADKQMIGDLVNILAPGDKSQRQELARKISDRIIAAIADLTKGKSKGKTSDEEVGKISQEQVLKQNEQVLKNYKYDDEDISRKVNQHIGLMCGGFRKINGLESSFLSDKKGGYNVCILPAVDSAGLHSPLRPFLQKALKEQSLQINEADKFPLKILFGYNLSQTHWNTGEIIVTKSESGAVNISATSYDPLGNGKLSPAIKHDIKTVFAKEFGDKAVFEFKETNNGKRQNDGVSCGLIVARDMIERIENRTLSKSYSPYAIVERKEDVKEFEKSGGDFFSKQKNYYTHGDSGFDHKKLSGPQQNIDSKVVSAFIDAVKKNEENLRILAPVFIFGNEANSVVLDKIRNAFSSNSELEDLYSQLFNFDNTLKCTIDTMDQIGKLMRGELRTISSDEKATPQKKSELEKFKKLLELCSTTTSEIRLTEVDFDLKEGSKIIHRTSKEEYEIEELVQDIFEKTPDNKKISYAIKSGLGCDLVLNLNPKYSEIEEVENLLQQENKSDIWLDEEQLKKITDHYEAKLLSLRLFQMIEREGGKSSTPIMEETLQKVDYNFLKEEGGQEYSLWQYALMKGCSGDFAAKMHQSSKPDDEFLKYAISVRNNTAFNEILNKSVGEPDYSDLLEHAISVDNVDAFKKLFPLIKGSSQEEPGRDFCFTWNRIVTDKEPKTGEIKKYFRELIFTEFKKSCEAVFTSKASTLRSEILNGSQERLGIVDSSSPSLIQLKSDDIKGEIDLKSNSELISDDLVNILSNLITEGFAVNPLPLEAVSLRNLVALENEAAKEGFKPNSNLSDELRVKELAKFRVRNQFLKAEPDSKLNAAIVRCYKLIPEKSGAEEESAIDKIMIARVWSGLTTIDRRKLLETFSQGTEIDKIILDSNVIKLSKSHPDRFDKIGDIIRRVQDFGRSEIIAMDTNRIIRAVSAYDFVDENAVQKEIKKISHDISSANSSVQNRLEPPGMQEVKNLKRGIENSNERR